jgi:parvulin-like peptidyl-prolyl isomerase
MKKIKRLPKLPAKRPFKRRPAPEERLKEAFANVPKITNETVAEHREDVLAGARKFIYPLKHSRRRVVAISSTIFIAAVVIFMAYVSVSLYRFQSTSGFLYGVTKVIPFPVAKAGDSWVSYNSYLFELRHYMHYYETQQGVDFDSKSGKEQLANFKKQALQQVSNDAYVKQLAKKYRVRVSDRAVNNQVDLVRSQNRLGTSRNEFREVLNEFWGWDENDFKRSLKQQMLAQAVVAKADTNTNKLANGALAQLKSGADFATLAGQVSQDEATKGNGGQYPEAIDSNNADIPAIVMQKLFKLHPGQYSDIINTGYTLEIVKVNGVQDRKVQASHIVFTFRPIDEYVAPLKAKHKTQNYIAV